MCVLLLCAPGLNLQGILELSIGRVQFINIAIGKKDLLVVFQSILLKKEFVMVGIYNRNFIY